MLQSTRGLAAVGFVNCTKEQWVEDRMEELLGEGDAGEENRRETPRGVAFSSEIFSRLVSVAGGNPHHRPPPVPPPAFGLAQATTTTPRATDAMAIVDAMPPSSTTAGGPHPRRVLWSPDLEQ